MFFISEDNAKLFRVTYFNHCIVLLQNHGCLCFLKMNGSQLLKYQFKLDYIYLLNIIQEVEGD